MKAPVNHFSFRLSILILLLAPLGVKLPGQRKI